MAAILACTHGDEPAGLDAIQYLQKDLKLTKGTLLFILVNPAAALAQKRYIHHNMNRLPEDTACWYGTEEGARYAEILPLLQRLDGGVLDIHSTSAACPPMLVTVDNAGLHAARQDHIPFLHIISGIQQHLQGRFVISECTGASVKLLAECGQHLCPDAGSRAINISLSFLMHLGMIDMPHQTSIFPEKHLYHVHHAMRLPTNTADFRLEQAIAPFSWLEAGQAIACNGLEKLHAPTSGYAIMCPETTEPLDTREELLFLCTKRTLSSMLK